MTPRHEFAILDYINMLKTDEERLACFPIFRRWAMDELAEYDESVSKGYEDSYRTKRQRKRLQWLDSEMHAIARKRRKEADSKTTLEVFE